MKFSRIFCMALMMYAIQPWIAAQQSGNSGTSTGNSSTTAPKTSTTQPKTVTPQTAPTDTRITLSPPELIFISGNVILDDGMPPPYGTTIVRYCGGSIIIEAMVNSNGHYSFQVGDRNRVGQVFPDASQSMGQDPLYTNLASSIPEDSRAFADILSSAEASKLFGCELRAQLSGYQSTSITLTGGLFRGLVEVGTLVLSPNTRVRGRSVSATNLLAPKAAQKALENAAKAFEEGSKAVEKFIKKALEIYPQYAEAWVALGDVYEEQNLNKESRDAYSKAIELDRLYLGPYIGLSKLAAKENKWQEVVDYTDQVLNLDPIDVPEGYFLNALAYYNMNKLDRAEKSALRGRQLDLENRIPRINLILANILVRKNDNAGAVAALKAYLKAAPNAPDTSFVRARIQENEKLARARSAGLKPQ
jgi:tetratricopeptide (TPR) repeat protein